MAISEIAVEQHGLIIDGEVRAAGSGATFLRESPYSRVSVAEYANADARDAEAAITVARARFDAGTWSTAAARQRHRVLARAARLLEEHTARIANRIVLEAGKPIALAEGEVAASARVVDYYAGLALSDEGSAISERTPGALGMILREPIGVAGMISAWNFPLAAIAQKVAPALAAGCTIVLKPSHFCASPALILAELLQEAGLPAGVINVVTSDLERGALVGQVLAASEDVDKIALTGSTAAGRAVMRAAASNTKSVSLELGGKSANIVFDDAPFDVAVATALSAYTFFSGQQCSAGSRLLVQRGIHDEFVAALAQVARGHVLGDPSDRATTMGPLINSDQLDRVMEYIEIGRAEGRLVTGGGQPEGHDPETSLFVEPTIFDHVGNGARLAQEEVFGPVLAVIPFDTEDEAIALANASDYGLAGGVWTTSIDKALRVVKGVRTGKMFVNSYNTAGIDDMPHGGYKHSGIGRECGLGGLAEYQELKTVQIKLHA
jgi:acyl-CoA reductase-like NAD-dependent aldehyde dehydrogenase